MSMFNARRFETRDAYGGIHNPFENPSVPLSSVGLDTVFGSQSHSDSGEDVTPDTAMTITTFWRCVGLMSTIIATSPLRTYKDPGKVEQSPRILSPSNTNTLYTPFLLWEQVVAHLCLWGNAYVLKVRDALDRIIDLRPIAPARVGVSIAPKQGVDDEGMAYAQGDKIFTVKQVKPDGTPDNSKPPIIWTTWEVMHIPGLGYDGLQGLSPVENQARMLGTTIAADKLAAKFYAKGTMLTGVINVKAPLASQQQADEIRRRWMSKNGGIGATAEVAVMDAETSFTPLTIPPDSLQFLESRQWQSGEVAKMFGIPPHLVGDTQKSTSWGSGIEQQNIAFVDYTISGWTTRIQQQVTREILSPNNWYAEFDLDRLMKGDMGARFEAYAVGIQWGFLTRNEVRLRENLQPIKGLNQPLVPMNMTTGNPNDVLGDPGAGNSPTEGGTTKAGGAGNGSAMGSASINQQKQAQKQGSGQKGSNSTSGGASKPSNNPNTKG